MSDRARELLDDPESEVALSVASVWELAIKVAKGLITLPAPLSHYVPDRLERNRFGLLPIELAHALRVASLPRIHGDPFDRLLIAQAQVEGIPIITSDSAIAQYDVETIW
jgi:PIN domain nuclease of toxin-antitoxin system